MKIFSAFQTSLTPFYGGNFENFPCSQLRPTGQVRKEMILSVTCAVGLSVPTHYRLVAEILVTTIDSRESN